MKGELVQTGKKLFLQSLPFALTAGLVIGAVLIRLPALQYPSSGWRQDQTVMTAYWFTQNGISLTGYETPLFGPPWRIPLEFPFYQAAGALLAKTLQLDVEFACRLLALIVFLLSAAVLYLISRIIFAQTAIGTCIVLFYLWTPYNIKFSTEPLIDYTALLFGLCYLYYTLRWLNHTRSYANALAAIVFGMALYLTKITTAPIALVPVGLFVAYDIYNRRCALVRLCQTLRLQRHSIVYLVVVACIIALPAAAGFVWARYASSIRAASPFSEFLSNENLSEWNFGTWAQKLSVANWLEWIGVLQVSFFPGVFLALPLIAGLWLFNLDEKQRILVFASFAGPLLTIFIFFNLYRHDYYYIAVSSSAAVVGGAGLSLLWNGLVRGRVWFVAVLTLLAMWPIHQGKQFLEDYWLQLRNAEDSLRSNKILELVKLSTAEEERVVSLQSDWDPALSRTHRKLLILAGQNFTNASPHLESILKSDRFSTVVSSADDVRLPLVLSHWKYSYEISPRAVWRVSDAKPVLLEPPIFSLDEPNLRIAGGDPYAEIHRSVLLLKQKRSFVRVKITYRTSGAANPYLIFSSGSQDNPYPLHLQLEKSKEFTTAEKIFFLPSTGQSQSVILRNWSDSGEFLVNHLELNAVAL